MASNRLKTQAVWVDAGVTSFNGSALFAGGQLGEFFEKDSKKYQLVKFASTTTTIAAGTPVLWTDRPNFTVSAKLADSKKNQIAGVALCTVTAGNYGFIQVRGNYSAVITDGGNDGVAGDTFVFISDGAVDAAAAGTLTYIPLGVATASESASAVALDLCPPLNGE